MGTIYNIYIYMYRVCLIVMQFSRFYGKPHTFLMERLIFLLATLENMPNVHTTKSHSLYKEHIILWMTICHGLEWLVHHQLYIMLKRKLDTCAAEHLCHLKKRGKNLMNVLLKRICRPTRVCSVLPSTLTSDTQSTRPEWSRFTKGGGEMRCHHTFLPFQTEHTVTC